MINEMRQTRGHVIFGGPVSYGTCHSYYFTFREADVHSVPQQAWVQSGSIRDNITFSSPNQDVDIDRVNLIIDACGLRPDVEMWQDGDESVQHMAV
jgi:ATP-binding cassette subfamily C (CFTR/MRP) protein 1